jgi:hypothetical protein
MMQLNLMCMPFSSVSRDIQEKWMLASKIDLKL